MSSILRKYPHNPYKVIKLSGFDNMNFMDIFGNIFRKSDTLIYWLQEEAPPVFLLPFIQHEKG